MSYQRVPQEVADYVLDFLYDDPKALRACARTCRSWLPHSSRRLFSKVTLQNRKSCSAFSRMLLDAPHIGHLVRDLNIASLPTRRPTSEVFDLKCEPLECPITAEATTSLTAIQHLSIVLAYFDVCRWDGLTRLQSVTHLTLQYCHFPSFLAFTTFVCAFPNLEILEVSDSTWANNEMPPLIANVESKLTKLVLGAVTSLTTLVQWLLSTELHTGLSSVSVRCSSENDAVVLYTLLSAVGDTLSSLEVDWLLREAPFAAPLLFLPTVTLEACTYIKNVSLKIPIYKRHRLTWLTNFLSLIVATNELETISVELRMLGEVDPADWEALRAVLSGRRVRTLRRFVVKMLVWPTSSLSGQDMRPYIHDSLPELSASGILALVRA